MPKLKLTQLEADPKNPNICSLDILAKLKRNIQRTGLYDYPIVRPHPSKADTYIIIDGHARVQIFQELGWEEVFCQVWKISEKEAKLALATLNRLRGTDIPYKRAELIAELVETISPEELAELIPETNAQIQDLLSLLVQDTAAMEKALKAEIEREEKTLPIPLTFVLTAEESEIWEKTHDAFANGMKDRSKVLILICNQALESKSEKGDQDGTAETENENHQA
jgi:ParB-like chromosome segregation protein Spo0J